MSIENITPSQAQALLTGDTGHAYIDVRSEPEFEQGHPAGALNIPYMHQQDGGMVPNPDFVEVVEHLFEEDDKLILGCQSGVRSSYAAQELMAMGFTDLANVEGGFGGAQDAMGQIVEKGWLQLDLPVEKGAHPERGYQALRDRAGR
ncbi:MAG: rhodanese-like domain-containing protein [Candidatus Latescibacteria bacterium]|nr:rhodanese-like domain-containing protein [Candidatus Latescibacterota bacterium]